MGKRGENIYKRKDGRWEGRYPKHTENGRRKYGSVYGKTYKDTKEKLIEARSVYAQTVEQENAVFRHGTFSEISRAWLESKTSSVKESTYLKYGELLDYYILPKFGEEEFSKICTSDIEAFFAYLLESGGKSQRGLSGSTLNQIRTILSGIRDYAIAQKYCVNYSLSNLKIKSDASKSDVFTRDEFVLLSDYLIRNLNRFCLGVLLCMYTGIRIGELCALSYNDIDLDKGVISIEHTIERVRIKIDGKYKSEVRLYTPKSIHSRRKVPVPDFLRELLGEYEEDGGYLLTGKHDKYMEPRNVQKRFKTILKKIGISQTNFHTTRHSFSTRCVECGVEAKALSEILGHTNVAFTLQRYYHPSMDTKRENINLLSNLMTVGEDRQN